MEKNNQEIIKYIDTVSKDYKRAYANTTLSTLSPNGDVVLDFCEEYLKPFLIVERPVNDNNTDLTDTNVKFNRPYNVLEVEREMKFSVTMSREQARQLAGWIISNIGEVGDQ